MTLLIAGRDFCPEVYAQRYTRRRVSIKHRTIKQNKITADKSVKCATRCEVMGRLVQIV